MSDAINCVHTRFRNTGKITGLRCFQKFRALACETDEETVCIETTLIALRRGLIEKFGLIIVKALVQFSPCSLIVSLVPAVINKLLKTGHISGLTLKGHSLNEKINF